MDVEIHRVGRDSGTVQRTTSICGRRRRGVVTHSRAVVQHCGQCSHARTLGPWFDHYLFGTNNSTENNHRRRATMHMMSSTNATYMVIHHGSYDRGWVL